MRPIAPGQPVTDRQKFGMIKWTGGDSRLLQTEDALKIAEGFEL